ncbi:glycosyltransferase family 4 protein [Paenibacillus sanguinis]|uniref:glycosyltransferase family 4 protein n=1 Tax=Paenibacillus sanguinis TaxID=225906 RepID=UPI00037F464C|nr:glycosyltransferase [Paenibacillus sanguinis]
MGEPSAHINQAKERARVPGKRKLLLFSHVCNIRNVTGAEKLLLFCARKLQAHYDCTIVVPRQGSLTVQAKRYGIRTIICDNGLLYGMCSPHAGLSGLASAVAWSEPVRHTVDLLTRECPDLVLVNTSVNVSPAIAAKQLGIPVAWQITEVIAQNEHTAEAVSIIDRYSDLVIGISKAVLHPFQGSAAEGKTLLLYPSWNPEDIHPEAWYYLRRHKRGLWKVKPAERLVGYISSYLIPEKGADHFLRAALQLADSFSDAKFIIIGAEMHHEFYRSLQDMVSASPYRDRFIFANFQDRIEAVFAAMDLVIVPPIAQEGFGLTALEGMVFGKPVVAYASGGLKEILEATGNASYLAATRDWEGLASRAAQLLSSPGLAEEVGQSNRAQSEAIFGPSAYDDRLLGLVEQMNGLHGSVVPLPEPQQPPLDEVALRAIESGAKESAGNNLPILGKGIRLNKSPKRRGALKRQRRGKGSTQRGITARRKRSRRGTQRLAARRRRSSSVGSRRRNKRHKSARR